GGIARVVRLHHRVRHPHIQWVFPPVRPGAQHVQALPRDDRRQPPPDVRHVVTAGAGDPQPGFLQRVVRFGERAEHPVSHGAQPQPVLLEPRCPEFVVRHCHILSPIRVTGSPTEPTPFPTTCGPRRENTTTSRAWPNCWSPLRRSTLGTESTPR